MKYTKIESTIGSTIESAINQLKDYGSPAMLEFNGQMLYSDVDDVDSAYKKITGKTKQECDDASRKQKEEYEARNKKHKESIPQLTKEWIAKGKEVLDKEYHKLWSECVPIRLSDLYQGMELGATLEIVKPLNEGCELDDAKAIIQGQGHSGMSYGLVRSMVKSFCKRGEDFAKHVQL